jgi:predicted MFS family arabinose efflux permease
VFTAGPLRILAATPPHQHSAASGVFFASNFLAWLAGVAVYGQVARLIGFGPLPVIAMLPTLLGLLVASFLPHRAAETEATTVRDFLRPFSSQLHRLVMFFMALSAFAFGLMFSTLAQFLTRTFGPALFSVGLFSFYLARLPGSLVAGTLISRWGQRRFLAVIFGLSGVALLVVSAYSGVFAIVLAAIVVLGFQQATVPVAAMALAGSETRPGARKAGYGLLFAAAELGVAGSLVLAQAAGDLLGNVSHVFLVFAIAFVLGGLVAWRLGTEQAE